MKRLLSCNPYFQLRPLGELRKIQAIGFQGAAIAEFEDDQRAAGAQHPPRIFEVRLDEWPTGLVQVREAVDCQDEIETLVMESMQTPSVALPYADLVEATATRARFLHHL